MDTTIFRHPITLALVALLVVLLLGALLVLSVMATHPHGWQALHAFAQVVPLGANHSH